MKGYHYETLENHRCPRRGRPAGGRLQLQSSSGGSSSGGSNTSAASTVTISNESGQLWTCGFNPYNGSTTLLSVGFVYEPLVFVNPLQNGKTTPMLATAWKWGAGNKSLTFTIRKGVKFTNGTADDRRRTWCSPSTCSRRTPPWTCPATGRCCPASARPAPTRSTMTFKAPAVPYFYYIADQTPIVPAAHLVEDRQPGDLHRPPPGRHRPVHGEPVHRRRTSPTRPTRTTGSRACRSIKKVQYPAFTSNDTANDQLANGQAQWGSQYIPSIKAFYTSKSPDNHYWFPPTVNVSLVPNLTNPLLANVKVRQAMSYAIDRAKVSSIGESGYEPPANQTGIVTPTFSSWLDSSLTSKYNFTYNPAKAKPLLASAGFKLGSDGIMANSKGQKLVLHRDQHRRLLGLGRLDAGHPAEPQGGRHPADAEQPGRTPPSPPPCTTGKYQLAYYDQQTVRPGPVLRAAELARLAQHGPDRQDGRQQLRALHQPGR